MSAEPGPAASNPETGPYWAAAIEGRLIVKHCRACGEAHHYPRALCPFCFSDETEWRDGAGTGRIYAFSTLRKPDGPAVLAFVTLDEGPSMMTTIVDCDPAALSIGQPVRVVFRPGADGGPAPMFTPL